MMYDDCKTRDELIRLALQDGYSLDDSGKILTPGRYGGEDVAVLYWDDVEADVMYDFGGGCSDWCEIRSDEYDLLPRYTTLASIPRWACVLTDSQGNVCLSYWDTTGARAEMEVHEGWSQNAD